MESIITSKTLHEIEFLLKERMGQHRSPDMPEYNQCDTAPCCWCVIAKRVLDEICPKLYPNKPKAELLFIDGSPQVKVGQWVQMDGGGMTFQETDEL